MDIGKKRMKSAFPIRRLSQHDLAVFKAIRLESLSVEPEAFASSYAQWACFSDDEWRSRLTEPVFVAFDCPEPIGIMALRLNRPAKMAHRAVLTSVYVRARYRSSGVADMLLRAVASSAKDDGIAQIELGVRRDNQAALRFYARNGFRVVGSIPCGYRDERGTAGEILMLLPLVHEIMVKYQA
jgi:ribosomal protein S18 acetylase RimI-like enzyme